MGLYPCLNPCFTGKWFLSAVTCVCKDSLKQCLNPCFTGKWFLRLLSKLQAAGVKTVLILVLLENGF